MFNVELPAGLVAAGTKARTAANVCFLEGPAWHASGDLYFSDISGNRILKMTPDGSVSVFRADSGRTNGNTFDAEGRLISCEGAEFGPGGRRRVVRTDLETGEVEVLTERFEGKRYNAPNDVCVDTRGRIWFTDPYYWTDLDSLEMGCEAVYCIEGDTVRRVVSQPAIGRPNGLAITPDDKTLYVIDSHNVAGGNRKIWAFDVSADGDAFESAAGVRFWPRARRRRHAARSAGQPVDRRRRAQAPQSARDGRRANRHLRRFAAGQAAGPNSHPRGRADEPHVRGARFQNTVRHGRQDAVQDRRQHERLLALSAPAGVSAARNAETLNRRKVLT